MAENPTYEELKRRLDGVVAELAVCRQFKEKLEESEERFRQIAENAEEWIWEVDRNGVFTYCSPVIEKIIALRPEEIVGNRYFYEIFHPSGQKKIMEEAFERFKRKKPFKRIIYKEILADGKEIWLSVSGSPIFNRSGSIKGYRGTCSSITQQREMEAELREAENYLMSLADDASNFAVYRLGYDGNGPGRMKLIFASKTLEDIMGIDDPSDLESWYSHLHRDEMHEMKGGKKGEKMPVRFNKTMRIYNDKMDEWRWIRAISARVQGKDEKLKYVNGLVIDITNEKLAEKELRKREKELRAKTNSLEAVNTALKVLLKRRDEDRSEIEEKVCLTVKQLIEPYVEKLSDSKLDHKQKGYVEILKNNLNNIVSPFSHTLSSEYFNLTSSEIKIANLIKQGNTTKEIASLLNLTPRTVSFHRENIRKKIGIKNQKINLHARLQSFK